jgi:hypothetical protein
VDSLSSELEDMRAKYRKARRDKKELARLVAMLQGWFHSLTPIKVLINIL